MSFDSLAIDVKDLTKIYPGAVRAVDGVSFTVQSGTVFGLLGPNGAGKSTIIKILTTLSRPGGGSVRVAGVDVVAEPGPARRMIGCVAQQSGVDPIATGRENLTLQGRLYGLGGRRLRTQVDDLLERFGLSEYADRPARACNGGMRRRLDVAMGLVHEPHVLFLDEPTTGLDPETRKELWAEIFGMAAVGITVVLSTHYLEEAEELADTLGILDRGKLVAMGTPAELKREMHGDALRVELVEPPGEARVRSALSCLEGVCDIVVAGSGLSARIDPGTATAPVVLAALESAGVRVVSLTLSPPTIDDVYSRHAGRLLCGMPEARR
ncbi:MULTISPECIES: ATP-binding cassette domain-containing protein [Actinomadura]|uniref:ATP-binding cassette domain-containing protein n=1 Tax=Actinomadura yumaensis TaxID=111807 RepID=A0ABW2CRL9_9ACTN|nr:ATP-binding cassette domain-containing protein [Actinomadura sp. J1-007]MWK36714.1 ATP-binding cassette domain-containing protein [Actinomadura sp. J1-007]